MKVEQKETITPEEYKRRKEEAMGFWDNEIPALKKQIEYQSLVTDLEELRARYIRAQVMIANTLAPPPDDMDKHDPEPAKDPKVRTLKKEPV